MLEEYPEIMKVSDIQSVLRISRSKAYELTKNGTIRCFKVGNSVRITKASLIEFLCEKCYSIHKDIEHPATNSEVIT